MPLSKPYSANIASQTLTIGDTMNDNIVHATSTPASQDVVIRDAEVFVDPDFTNGELTLSDAEVAFFKAHGFIVKRGFLNEHETFERIVDYLWENVPRGLIKRGAPQTWLDAPHERWTEQDAENVGLLAYGNWKMRSRGGIGTEPFLVDNLGNHPNMRKLVSLFIGSPVKRARRVRGIYGVFPKPPGSEGRLGPHSDYAAAQLSAMVLVDRVPPRCGGFTIWPGSHHLLHPHWDTMHGSTISPECAQGYCRARDAALRDITPLEFPGVAGDVVFWHPRVLHSAGVNHSADLGRPILRLVVPCDYQRADLTFFDDLEYGPGPNHQWWVDTRNFREDVVPTKDNIWHGWVFDQNPKTKE
jgi:hypothetical protein